LVVLAAAVAGQLPSIPATAAGLGTVLEYQVIGASFNGLSMAGDGNVWLTDAANHSIDRLNFDGSLDRFPLPGIAPRTPTDITWGPDGNPWFLASDGQHATVGRVWPDGLINLYETGAQFASGIAIGSDGFIWFGESEPGPVVARLGGPLTEYSIPPEQPAIAPNPTSIARGPDYAQWVTDPPENAILRVTSEGSFTRFKLPRSASQPNFITLGGDGNLWFGEQNPGRIGRMTPTGALTEFALPSSAAVLAGIAQGPDGNVWFTENVSARGLIGEITPAGRMREFPIPSDQSGPGSPAIGPDGNMWFPERAGFIGEVIPGPWPPATAWSATTMRSPSAQSPAPTALMPWHQRGIRVHAPRTLATAVPTPHALATTVPKEFPPPFTGEGRGGGRSSRFVWIAR
jgi:streptogramin lyase